MVDKVEITTEDTSGDKPVETQPAHSKPQGLPEKFNSVEELAKSYEELEKKLGGQSQPKIGEPTLKEETKVEENNNTLEIAEKAVEEAGLDMVALQKEYSEKGELDTKSYKALEKAGISKTYVDNYIAGQQSLADAAGKEVKSVVGGDDAYNDMANWAASNMSEGEKKAYNTAVNSPDMDTVKLAVIALQAQYQKANGTEPKNMQGTATPSKEAGFESWAQVTAAMSDSRYAKDTAYQKEVKTKLSHSNI